MWGTFICLAGVHKAFAWLATIGVVAWLWYFIDLHRVRMSPAGMVCFGDVGLAAHDSSVYLLSEGTFLQFMIVSQWLLISLVIFGLTSNFIVFFLRKCEKEGEPDDAIKGTQGEPLNESVNDSFEATASNSLMPN